MRARLACLAVLTPAMMPGALAAGPCPAESALYVQRGDNGTELALLAAGSFGTAASNLFLRVRTARQSYWFRIQAANGYGGLTLEAIRDPSSVAPAERGQPIAAASDTAEPATPLRLIPLRRDLSEIADAPRAGSAAPAILFLPDLGPTLWYDSAELGGSGERELVSRSAFVLAACGRR